VQGIQSSEICRPNLTPILIGDADSPSWYCLQAKPRQEQRAETNLLTWCNGVYLPQIEMRCDRCRNASKCPSCGGTKKVKIPVFAGYLFAQFKEQRAGLARVTHGVVRILEFGGVLATVPHLVVEEMRQRFARFTHYSEITRFSGGQSVTITQGPFAGFVAKVETADKDGRVKLLMEAMRQGIAEGRPLTRAVRLTVNARDLRLNPATS
jgi:transcriptional antiterminator RfaH